MITQAIRDEAGDTAVWLDEASGPLAPRNIYGVTKLAAKGLCRVRHAEHGLNLVVRRTGRFFPDEDDTHSGLSGENLKANELLHRRLTVEDAADAHLAALVRAPALGFGAYAIFAPTRFVRSDAKALKRDAGGLVARYFPDAPDLYARRGWALPTSIGRVYDSSLAARELGLHCHTDFGAVLEALRTGAPYPSITTQPMNLPRRRPPPPSAGRA